MVAYINFADIDGAYELARYYIVDNGWEIKEMEDEYFIINSIDEVNDEQVKYVNEAFDEGYSIVFYSYESEDEN